MTDQPATPPWSATPDELTERFLYMLDICERRGWRYLAELAQQQLDKLWDGDNG